MKVDDGFLVLSTILLHTAMDDAFCPPPDMRDLMAAVDEVVLYCGYVEAAILERLAAIDGPAAKPPKISPLARWKRAETAKAEVIEL